MGQISNDERARREAIENNAVGGCLTVLASAAHDLGSEDLLRSTGMRSRILDRVQKTPKPTKKRGTSKSGS